MQRIVWGLLFWCLLEVHALAIDGSSGCGPAWYVFKENSLVSSSLRATTNTILLPTVTFGMTFGTSDCAKHSIVDNDKHSLYFLAHNRDVLASQLARGKGEHLNSFGDSLGCSWWAQDTLNTALRQRLGSFFQSELDSVALLAQTRSVIHHDPVLREACST